MDSGRCCLLAAWAVVDGIWIVVFTLVGNTPHSLCVYLYLFLYSLCMYLYSFTVMFVFVSLIPVYVFAFVYGWFSHYLYRCLFSSFFI